MTNARHSCHRAAALRLPWMRLTSVPTSSLPSPIPANECKVVPPTWHAAMPVEPVTKTQRWPCSPSSACTMWLSVNDLPVPAPPVRKKLSPALAASTALRCCWLSEEDSSMRRLDAMPDVRTPPVLLAPPLRRRW